MNYELAKKLKDNGWPFIEIKVGDHGCRESVDFNPSGDPEIGPQHFFLPTLSELIEACGNNFGGLEQTDSVPRWHAVKFPLNLAFHSDTPKEAVASLWLALKKK